MTPPPREKLQIGFKHGRFDPNKATVPSGTVITICDTGSAFVQVFTTDPVAAKDSTLAEVRRPGHIPEWTLPGQGKQQLKPGQCGSFKVHNSTKKPAELHLFSALQSFAKLTLTIEPAK